MIKRVISIAIPVLIVALLINDGGRYLQAKYTLGNVTRDAASECAAFAKHSKDRNSSWRAGEKIAEVAGATIYGFDIAGGSVHVWTQMPVDGTWLLATAMSYVEHKPPAEALIINDDMSSPIY